MVRAACVVVFVCATAFVVGMGVARAEHAPVGSGGCEAHTTVCYPECRAEWGAVGLNEVERDFCPVGPIYDSNTVTVGNPVLAVTVDNPVTAVTVVNLPVEYPVVNSAGDRLDVDAVCEVGVPCVASGNAQEVRVTNGADDPAGVTLGGTTREDWLMLSTVAGVISGVYLFGAILPRTSTL